ncbi:MAG: hypothetical protein U0798_14370 [Gemmataceae bacterium]
MPEKPTRTELVKAVLSHPKLKLLDKFKAIGPVQPAGFGGRRMQKDVRDRRGSRRFRTTNPARPLRIRFSTCCNGTKPIAPRPSCS